MTKTWKWICRYTFFFILIVTLALWYFYCSNTITELSKISNNLEFINTATFSPTKAYDHLLRIDLFKELKLDVFKAIIFIFSCTIALVVTHIISNKVEKKRALKQKEFQRAYNENINSGYNDIVGNDNEQSLISFALDDSAKRKDAPIEFNSEIPSAEEDDIPIPSPKASPISFETEIDDDIDESNYDKTMIFTGINKAKETPKGSSDIIIKKEQLSEPTSSESQNGKIESEFTCPKCGFSYDKKPKFCAKCGTKIQ